ncbi:MAG: hypothetical protein HY543_04480 [Deltaproteobacteria bacterium]|nr:hypothetical protein [Deltaproteobacteria bacterium]
MKIKTSLLLFLGVFGLLTAPSFRLSAREGTPKDKDVVQEKAEAKEAVPVVKAGGKISGVVFGDFAWFVRYHTVAGSTTNWEKKTAFWIRRAYFTYDHTFDEHFSGRFRLEAVSGDFDDNGGVADILRPFVKEASLKWKPNNHRVSVGMIPTPTWIGLVEDHWGYRSVEKTPLDLQGFGSAVDLGVSADGSFMDGKISYAAVVGNGSGTRWEINSDKKFYGALTVKPVEDLAIQAYGDYETGTGHTDRFNLQGFVGYTREKWRLGALFNYRHVQLAAGGSQKIKLISGHGAFRIVKRLWGFARVDHLFDPNPGGNTIQYLPFHETAKPTLAVAGLDFEARKNIHILPNVETIFYNTVAGVRPRTDIVPRLTVAWNF